jgi:hypothetical protein
VRTGAGPPYWRRGVGFEPDPPVPYEERKLSIEQVASRWRCPRSHVRIRLLNAGVPLVDVPRSPTEGVQLVDLEEYERRLRHGDED